MRDCVAFNNNGNAIQVSFESLVRDSIADSNSLDGIVALTGSRIRNCIARNNSGDGIEVKKSCLVLENNCDANGFEGSGAGIHITDTENRVEGNKVTGNDRGLDVDAASNLIIRNTARGNSGGNFEIVAGHRVAGVGARAAICDDGPFAATRPRRPAAAVPFSEHSLSRASFETSMP